MWCPRNHYTTTSSSYITYVPRKEEREKTRPVIISYTIARSSRNYFFSFLFFFVFRVEKRNMRIHHDPSSDWQSHDEFPYTRFWALLPIRLAGRRVITLAAPKHHCIHCVTRIEGRKIYLRRSDPSFCALNPRRTNAAGPINIGWSLKSWLWLWHRVDKWCEAGFSKSWIPENYFYGQTGKK